MPREARSLDERIAELRGATERLCDCMASDAAPERLEAAQASRESLYLEVRRRVEAGEAPGEAGRVELRRILELDAEMIALGLSLQEAIQIERRDLARRRRAIRAHGQRERMAPRALTVKA
ncbi:MAG: hypothetical protein ACX98W_20000 [bacterium]